MDRSLARGLIVFGALLIALATAAGAVGSHVLTGNLDEGARRSFDTAVQFQFFHALGLMAVALHGERRPRSRLLLLAGAGLAFGIVLFCAGVYASALAGPAWLTALAPVGGVSLILSWIGVAVAVGLNGTAPGTGAN